MPPMAKELAWACQVGSYTDRERTPEMLARVKAFADSYPESGFLKSFVAPVREFQAGHIDAYFKSGDLYRALSFFEKNRQALFPKIPDDLAAELFAAYADVHRSEAAAEFWAQYDKTPASDLKALRQAVVAAEMLDRQPKAKAKGASPWAARDREFQRQLPKRRWALSPGPLAVGYLDRMAMTSTASAHLSWMLDLARVFGEKDGSLVCDIEYPLLSRLNGAGAAAKERVSRRTSELIAAQLPDLFRHDESCALSLLELEAGRLKGQPKDLGDQYLKRQDWPLVSGFLHLYWTMSEHVYDGGERGRARKMWEVIRDKGTPGSPEVEFAKARLDPTRTEFEKLWD
jgi:hypothetical protein